MPEGTHWLSLCAVAGPVVSTLGWLACGLLRPGYSPVNQPVSTLGVGPNGAFMNAAFVLGGLLMIVGVVGAFRRSKHEMGTVARWACTLLLIPSPLGMVWVGVFTLATLALHKLGAEVAFGTPVIAFPIVGFVLRRVSSWRRFGTWMILGGLLTLALLVGFYGSVPRSGVATGGSSYGLWERALILEIQGWYVAVGWLASQWQTKTHQCSR